MAENLTRREALATALSLTVLPAAIANDQPSDQPAAIPANALVVVVTDPLSAELSCDCVKGYAQRNYDKLGKYLESRLGRPVAVVYSTSLAGALTRKSNGRADLVIGKDSVVRAAGPANKLTLTRLVALTDKDGKTTQTGIICVPASDKALTPADLKGYTIYFGNPDAEEKSAAAIQVFKDFGVELPAKLETCDTCTTSAQRVVEEAKGGKRVATVISSYAQPLLEGCGTIKKGELRVIGETEPVPFIAAFATGSLSPAQREAVKAALLEVGKDQDLCKALETKMGFVEPPAKKK